MLFLIATAFWTFSTALGIAAPGLTVDCELPKPCVSKIDPISLLTEDERMTVARDPNIRVRTEAWAAGPWVRVGLAAIGLIEDAPSGFVLLGVGLALRRLGSRGDHVLARAVPWLRYAARAGMVWAVTMILTPGLRSVLLSPGLGKLQFPLDLTSVPLPLLLAVGAYAAIWAIEAGLRAQRDLDEFV